MDPVGLQEAGEDAGVSRGGSKRGDTLADVLHRALSPLKLGYFVTDGFLWINSRVGTVESRLNSVEEKLDRIMNALEKKGIQP